MVQRRSRDQSDAREIITYLVDKNPCDNSKELTDVRTCEV